MPIRSLAVLLALGCAGCLHVTPPGVAFATTPPGARVLIDGKECGYVTPCLIALDEEETHRIDLVLEGYRQARLRVEPGSNIYFIPWSDADTYPPGHYRFPLFLPIQDLFLPVRKDERMHPSRVHVRLQPAQEE